MNKTLQEVRDQMKAIVEGVNDSKQLKEFSTPQYCIESLDYKTNTVLYYNDVYGFAEKELMTLFNSEKGARKALANYLIETYPAIFKNMDIDTLVADLEKKDDFIRVKTDDKYNIVTYGIAAIKLSSVNPNANDMFNTPEFTKEIADGIDVADKIVVVDVASIPSHYRKSGDKYRLVTVNSKDTIGDTRHYFFSYLAQPFDGFMGDRIDIMGIASPEQVKEYVKKYPEAGQKMLEPKYAGFSFDPTYKQAVEDALNEINNK